MLCSRNVHAFSNGVRVFERHLIELQRQRYKQNNLHEAEEEPIFLGAINELVPGAAFVNVGAAIGYYVILARIRRPDIRVIGYEPLRLHRKYLRQNVKLNGLRRRDILIEPEGLGAEEGWAEFMIHDFSSMIRRPFSDRGLLRRLRGLINNSVITTVSLETLVRRAGGRVALLQMDIQGLEMPVLQSSRELLESHVVERLLVGTHSAAIHSSLEALLLEAGYHITWSEPHPNSQPDGIILASSS